jgi:S1/P1 Nuclease
MITHPHLISKAEHILSGLSVFTTFERDYPFVECATFADEIKDEGFDDQSHWHFVDTPLFEEGYQTTTYPQIYNVTWSMVIIERVKVNGL